MKNIMPEGLAYIREMTEKAYVALQPAKFEPTIMLALLADFDRMTADEAEATALRSRLDVVMGYDLPELFAGWTDNELDQYTQLSPPEIFNNIRRLRAQLAAAEQRVAAVEAWQPVEGAIIGCACGIDGCDGQMAVNDGVLQVETHGGLASMTMPDGWAVCKRVRDASE